VSGAVPCSTILPMKALAARPTQNPEQFRLPQRCGRADIGGDDARMFENIAWCAFGKGASIIKHVDAIGKVRHHLELMLDPDHGNSKFVLDAQNKTRQVLALVAIEPRRRFVEHQNRRLQSERARKPYQLLDAEREAIHQRVAIALELDEVDDA